MEKANKKVSRRLMVAVTLMVAGASAVLVSVWLDGALGICGSEWFQRSGSILTATAAWSLVSIEQAKQTVTLTDLGFEPEEFGDFRRAANERATRIAWVGVGLTVVGTIIWGYGDLMFNYWMC